MTSTCLGYKYAVLASRLAKVVSSKSTPHISWYSFLVTTVGSTVAPSGWYDDNDLGVWRQLRRLPLLLLLLLPVNEDWGLKAETATPKQAADPTDAARRADKVPFEVNMMMRECVFK